MERGGCNNCTFSFPLSSQSIKVVCVHRQQTRALIYIHKYARLVRDAPKKKNGFFWDFFPRSGPPPPPSPPFGNPCFQKKKCGLFCILGHLEHFWSSQKCSLFGNYSDIYFWEQVTPPPLSKEKIPKTSCFRRFFSEFSRFRIKSYVIKLIIYHRPPIVKHVLAPQNDFGMQNITWSNYKRSGILVAPPVPTCFFF